MKRYKEERPAGEKKTADSRKSRFAVLSNELKALIEISMREHDRLLIISGRRGLSQLTVCNDCGSFMSCEKCGASFVLHEKKGSRFFSCHKCGFERPVRKEPEEACKNCGSWRLAPLGIGTDRIHEELVSSFPSLHIFRADSDNVKTEKVLKKTVSDFYKTKGSVLLGTEMVMPYLEEPVEGGALLGIDSLFSVPDFRANERIFSLVLTLRAKTKKVLIIQTQQPEKELLDWGLKGDVLPFYRKEIAERKEFGYPPFSVLIKITWEAKQETIKKESEELLKSLSGYEAYFYSSTAKSKTGVMGHILIKVEKAKWVDEKLLSIMRALPPKFAVSVDPESII